MSSFERRKHHRVAASIAVEVRDDRGFSLLSTRDLSGGGAFFDRSIRCEAQISNVPDLHGYGLGVRFLDLSPGDEQRITQFTRAFSHRSA